MDKQAIITFFDSLAPQWDSRASHPRQIIDRILEGAGVRPGARVLDVGCGTGILIPDYLAREALVTAVDISPEMLRAARAKFAGTAVRFLLADAEQDPLGGPYDCVVVYNALPHFPDPARLLAHLGQTLAHGGTLTLAHGMSRARLEQHHSGVPAAVSRPLPSLEALEALLPLSLRPEIRVDNEEMIQLTARRT